MTSDPLAGLLELDGIADAVRQTRESVDKLLAHRVLRRRSSDVSAESLLRGAWASAALAGATVSLEEVRAGRAEDPIVLGSLRVSAELAPLSETWGTAHRQVLARLHALAAADLVAAEELGRPRPDREVAHRLDTLADVLTQTQAPAAVLAAITQAEITSLDAFAPVSGVVGRAAARLTLIDRGLDPKSLVALEVGQLECRPALDGALDGYRQGEPEGVARYVRCFCESIQLGARETLAICEAIQRG